MAYRAPINNVSVLVLFSSELSILSVTIQSKIDSPSCVGGVGMNELKNSAQVMELTNGKVVCIT